MPCYRWNLQENALAFGSLKDPFLLDIYRLNCSNAIAALHAFASILYVAVLCCLYSLKNFDDMSCYYSSCGNWNLRNPI